MVYCKDNGVPSFSFVADRYFYPGQQPCPGVSIAFLIVNGWKATSELISGRGGKGEQLASRYYSRKHYSKLVQLTNDKTGSPAIFPIAATW